MSFRFKSPGGDLNWLSPLMVLGGGFLCYHFLMSGSVVKALLFGTLAFLCSMLWFQQRWAAYPLLIYLGFAVFGGSLLLIFNGFEIRKLFSVLSCVLLIRELLKWKDGDDDTQETSYDLSDFESPWREDLERIEQLEDEDELVDPLEEKKKKKRGRWRSNKPGDTFEI